MCILQVRVYRPSLKIDKVMYSTSYTHLLYLQE